MKARVSLNVSAKAQDEGVPQDIRKNNEFR